MIQYLRQVLIAALLFSTFQLSAQNVFQSAVKVEFEKTVYVKQQYKAWEPEWFDMIKDRVPNEVLSYSDFIGDTTRSIYKPGKEVPVDPRSFYASWGDRNVVYIDYKKQRMVAQKPIFEETFLVDDSLPNIKWKITSDMRNIAGFECRKAIGILNDSIAVFAFYSDEILINGGPEGIHGLPGMILGVGIPRLHTTWFATKVEVNGINMNVVNPATKGKKVTNKTLYESLDQVLNTWNFGKKMKWAFMI